MPSPSWTSSGAACVIGCRACVGETESSAQAARATTASAAEVKRRAFMVELRLSVPDPRGASDRVVRWRSTLRSVGTQSRRATLQSVVPVSYTHLRAHETPEHLVCRLL